ncbi:hypothetical protein G7077_03410 [Sphingomonas piscis]|uniref:Peptidase M56 domain-containing protein n=1 Tax=Sphingomonas piscis TaxID=2714943 RepID=A0A6G7YMY7_9SPHN|nr:M56 family metallopeptidase [Sphingomonas piscis]QIK78102.1 hypothetical protein G7077_03410 [Sphingomonas piscis]
MAETLAATAVLILVVLVLRGPVARAFGARAAYALWLVPTTRLLLPPFAIQVPDRTVMIDLGAIAPAPALTAGWTFSLAQGAFALWLAGTSSFLLWHLLNYRRFMFRAVQAGRPLTDAAVPGFTVLLTSAVTGPAAAGILRRYILLPIDFASRFDAAERELALAHEAMHHRRGDLLASAAALFMVALHWFNPIAHIAHRLFRRDLEAACDASLIDIRGSDARHKYAQTILRCAAQPMPQTVCALTPIGELKERLTMLNNMPSRGRQLAGGAIALVLAGAGLTLAAPVAAQEKDVVERIEIRQIGGGDQVRRALPSEVKAKMAACNGEKFEADVNATPTAEKKTRTRMLICAKAGTTKAETAASLEKVLSRVEGDSDMPAENKAQLAAKLKARIAELKAGS